MLTRLNVNNDVISDNDVIPLVLILRSFLNLRFSEGKVFPHFLKTRILLQCRAS